MSAPEDSRPFVVEVKPRDDDKFDIYLDRSTEPLMNSSQGYSRSIDAVSVVRELWPPLALSGELIDCGPHSNDVQTVPDSVVAAIAADMTRGHVPIVLRVTDRDGKTWTEQLR